MKTEQLGKEQKKPKRNLFGTFSGVFTPTLLTILGVIMYLRLGWVTGNAGLLGAWAIILLSFGITGFTGLSLSSIATNIRIGSGGAFSVISQSLGLEIGGSIGIPLYISQTLAVVMYIFGFRAGWQWIFPEHPALMVDLIAFAVLFIIGFISAGLAFKVQYVILIIIISSLASVVVAVFTEPGGGDIEWWGNFPGSPENGFQGIGFWAVFAVFFPASTGIMAGANMSGDLKNPRKSIPIGTLVAIGISLVVYMLLALWLALRVPMDDLVGNYTVMVDRAAWGPAVLGGLLGATFSSALSSLVGAPRILQALGEHRILPGSRFFSKKSRTGEPRNGMLITGVIVLAVIMVRDLNAIAPLITMFFLLTYAMINFVVFIEQSLGLVSFRPLLRIPKVVSLIGGVGCLFSMFIVNPVFSLVAVGVVLILHAYLVRKHLKTPYSDVRSGLLIALAEWAAKKVEKLTAPRERMWKANLLVPVLISGQAEEFYPLLRSIASPRGFVRIVGLTGKKNYDELTRHLPDLTDKFREDAVFSNWTVIDAGEFGSNLEAGIEALGSAFFRSNVIFLRVPESERQEEDILGAPVSEKELRKVIKDATKNDLGVMLYSGETGTFEGPVHVFIRKPEEGWSVSLELGASDLAVLSAIKIAGNTGSRIHFHGVVTSEDEKEEALSFLLALKTAARVPDASEGVTFAEEENSVLGSDSAVCIFPVDAEVGFDELRRIADRMSPPCLFTIDSGKESALA